jgi:hypothetical protein
VLGTWAADRRDSVERHTDSWTLSVPALCRQLCAGESKDGFELARWILDEQWTGTMKRWGSLRQGSARLVRTGIEELDAPVLALFEGSVTARSPELQARMIGTSTSARSDYPIVALTRLLRTAHERHSATSLRELGLSQLHEHCRDVLARRLATPPRARDDWSIPAPGGARAAHAPLLAQFQKAADRVRFEWPLAKDQRGRDPSMRGGSRPTSLVTANRGYAARCAPGISCRRIRTRRAELLLKRRLATQTR